MIRIPLLIAAVALALPGWAAAQDGVEVDVDIGGTAPADASGPLRLSADGYGAGVAIDQEGTTHVGWLERRPDARDVMRYCRVERPGPRAGTSRHSTCRASRSAGRSAFRATLRCG